MKIGLLALTLIGSAATVCIAAESAKDIKEHIARRRAIAKAHLAVAKSLEAGTPDDVCNKALRDAWHGLAFGRFCGMKHGH